MRNLAQYPITREEIIECLTTLADEINAEERIGDLRPMMLRLAAHTVLKTIDEGAAVGLAVKGDDNQNPWYVNSGEPITPERVAPATPRSVIDADQSVSSSQGDEQDAPPTEGGS